MDQAHYKENDGLFDKPDVLRMTPLPHQVDAKELLHLHTIYTVKIDGRKNARTVRCWQRQARHTRPWLREVILAHCPQCDRASALRVRSSPRSHHPRR
jgi:hypothetical protein